MLSLFRLRRREPDLERPFAAPLYPWFPAIALLLAAISLLSMVYFNPVTTLVFIALMAVLWVFYRLTAGLRASAASDPWLATTSPSHIAAGGSRASDETRGSRRTIRNSRA